MHRGHRRHGGRFLAAIAGLAAPALLVVAAPAGADPTPAPLAAAAALTEDHSNEMPRTRHNEITGDFLGKGYDQRMVVESGNLNIYDSAAKGGALLRSTPTDLKDLTDPSNEFFDFLTPPGLMPSFLDNQVQATPLAWTPDALYMAGISGTGNSTKPALYRLPPDGSCAQASCAVWANHDLPLFFGEGFVATTSALAAGMIGTTPWLAVGFTNTYALEGTQRNPMANGAYLVDPADGTVRSTIGDFVQYLGSENYQMAVTALDWDDSGSGLLAIGTLSGTSEPPAKRGLHAVRVSADGTVSNYTTYNVEAIPAPLSATVGHRVDGSPVIAFGMDDGSVKLWNPAVTSQTLLAQVSGSDAVDGVDAVTFTDRFDGTVGLADMVAVSSVGNSARVLRYSGATTLDALAIGLQGGASTDVGGIRAWFPGYKTGLVQFVNASPSDPEIQLDFATRPNAAYGCWFSEDVEGVPAFPATPVIVDHSTLPIYSVAAFTALTGPPDLPGQGGSCATTDFTGQWAAYVVATPVGRPADRTVAKLVWSRSGELTVQSVGGSLKLVAQPGPGATHPLGETVIHITGPQPPQNPTKLTVTGKRLDPAGTARPVYRFDVAATTWPLPVSTPPRLQTVLPPLRVIGYTASDDVVPLGLLVPQGKPSRATSGSVTLSPVSFYWQNPTTGQQIAAVSIEARQGATRVESNIVALSDLPAPAAGTAVSQLEVCPATGSQTCDAKADPVANGLDQAPLRIQVFDANQQVLPITDPVYGQIYYRDQDGDLLTGLIPADGSSYIRVSPYAGAYPNDGSTSSTTRPPTGGTVGGRFGYLSTTSTVEQEITAYVGGWESLQTDPTTVDAINLTPQVPDGALAGHGFYVNGCTGDYTGTNFCRLAPITATAPGLFLTTDPDTSELRIGLQFATQAQISLTSLPLQQVAGQPEHTVAAQPLLINNGEVHLNTTSGFQPADLIDTWLISHGTQIPIRAIQVGGAN